MPTSRKASSAAAERIGEELRLIRSNVAGVVGSITATSDGLVIAHDVPDLEPTQVAALVATMQAVALRTTLATGRGQFREVVMRGSEGYLAVYAAGASAAVAVVGSSELNVGMLNFQARRIIDRIAGHATDYEKSARTRSRTLGQTTAEDETGIRPLPVRRPRTS